MLKIVVLISGGGSNLKALLEATDASDYPVRVVGVGSDTDASGLEYATERKIPTFIVKPLNFESRIEWGEALLQEIGHHTPDLVVSAGLMRILPPNVVDKFFPHIINTHPALLPLFPGAHAVRDALVAGVTETGVTVHVIDTGVDTGPIIRQASVRMPADNSEAELHERIKAVERPLLVQTVRDIATGAISLAELTQ